MKKTLLLSLALLTLVPSIYAMEQTAPAKEQASASKHTLKNYAQLGLGLFGCYAVYKGYANIREMRDEAMENYFIAEKSACHLKEPFWDAFDQRQTNLMRAFTKINFARKATMALGLVSGFFLYNSVSNFTGKKLSFKPADKV